jgi:hypothetical protein
MNQSNPELSTGLTPIKEPTPEEMQARRELSARMTSDYSSEATAERVKKLVEDADALRQARSQPITMPSPEVITLLAEERRKRRGL